MMLATQDSCRKALRILLAICLALSVRAWSAQTDISGPAGSGVFGKTVTVLSNGNFVVTDPNYSIPAGAANVGAVYLYNSAGALISTLTGSTANDNVGSGGVVLLSNGNYVILSLVWNKSAAITNVGAVTWGSKTAGVSGVVSAANSLIGSTAYDRIGNTGVTALNNGNYVVDSYEWNNGAATFAGAVTWGDGTTGISGVVSAANSLVGGAANDLVGESGVTALSNGNYVVRSPAWIKGAILNAGAATWCNGTTGATGAVSVANSLVGSTANDFVGNGGVTALSNGNYVVISTSWNNGAVASAGAATWGNGTTGISGAVSAANSLVGTTANDRIGYPAGVTALNNGNYVVASEYWNNGTGAATWASGSAGISGPVSVANSLVGSSFGYTASNVAALTNGNYVVCSPSWNSVGAATWGNGTTGITGAISAANSLVGSTNGDAVGGRVTVLTNGNYVVQSEYWSNGAATSAGAATWGNGTTGITGAVSAANSLVGSSASDTVTFPTVTPLPNGNYVVRSSNWNNGAAYQAGAVTWGNGTTGVSGVISAANSLIGTTASDNVGYFICVLNNGNYVVGSPNWHNGPIALTGAATWANGTTGITGPVSTANSLYGSAANDAVGSSLTALANGNYVVSGYQWSNLGFAAVGNGASGITGVVSSANALVGSQPVDYVANNGVTPYSDGNYAVRSSIWNNGAVAKTGAITLGNGSGGTIGLIDGTNSIRGTVPNKGLNLVFDYDASHAQLVVGRPDSNIVSLLNANPPGPAAQLAFIQQPSSTVSTASIAPAVAVEIQDAAGHLIDTTANVTIAIGTNAGGGILSGTMTVAAVEGVATFSGLSIDKSGTGYTLSATSAGLATATSAAFNITPGPPTKLTYSQQPSNTASGSSISPAVAVQILDAQNNLTSSTANVTVTIGTNPGAGPFRERRLSLRQRAQQHSTD